MHSGIRQASEHLGNAAIGAWIALLALVGLPFCLKSQAPFPSAWKGWAKCSWREGYPSRPEFLVVSCVNTQRNR